MPQRPWRSGTKWAKIPELGRFAYGRDEMRSKYLAAVLAAACLAALGATVATAGTTLSTDLVGAEERPGPGDPDGTGFVTLTFNQGRGEICFELSLSGIDAAT